MEQSHPIHSWLNQMYRCHNEFVTSSESVDLVRIQRTGPEWIWSLTSQVCRSQEGIAKICLYPSSSSRDEYLNFTRLVLSLCLLKLVVNGFLSAAFVTFLVKALARFVFNQRGQAFWIDQDGWRTQAILQYRRGNSQYSQGQTYIWCCIELVLRTQCVLPATAISKIWISETCHNHHQCEPTLVKLFGILFA